MPEGSLPAMIGQTLGHYRIESRLGEGGMGVVYRAQDMHLNRPVAIKVLRSEVMRDPGRIRRFVQEAQAASALNHPNIITVYDIDRAATPAGDVDFMAMEYVAGTTLDRLIGRGLALGEALNHGVQIASALARAHAAGIVHRDLKPQNVMVTGPASGHPGLVKVLDFGLAKLTEAESDELGATQTLQPNAPRTEEGAIIGTVAYMSPEQAEGKKIDARSDIFSFGSVLYEMITGQRAFAGETRVSTWSAILNKQPRPLREIVAAAPQDLEKILRLCLEKDPARRVQHMDDVKILLEQVKAEPESVQAAVPDYSPRRVSAWAVAAALLLAAAGAGAAWWWRSRLREPARQPVLSRVTSDSGLTTDPALSSDGKLLAYASDRSGDGHLDLWVRQVAGGQPIRLTSDIGDDHQPAFSPDGAQIAFRSEREEGGIYVVAALGGEPRLLARHGRNPRFSPDGQWVAYWIGEQHSLGKIYAVPAAGGMPKQLPLQAPPAYSAYPVWSPDGKHLLFLGSDQYASGHAWWTAAVDTGAAVRIGVLAILERQGLTVTWPFSPFPADWVGDRIFFSARAGDSAGLWQLPMSAGDWRIRGPAARMTSGTGLDTTPSVSATGRVAFSSLVENVDVWSLPLDANQGKPKGEIQRLTYDAAADTRPSITGNGKQMVFESNRSGHRREVWMKDLESGRETLLAGDAASEGPLRVVPPYPQIAADSHRVAYLFAPATYLMEILPGGKPRLPEKVCEGGGFLADISADGSKILHWDYGAFGEKGITLLEIRSGKRTKLFQHPDPECTLADPRFSPDQRWAAFHSYVPKGDPTRRQIFIAPLRPAPPQEWIAVTDGLGMDRWACWSPNGNLLYWISERDGFACIAARRLEPATKKPVGDVFYVQHFHSARRSMMNLANPNFARPSVARDRIVFTLAERTGNIWMTDLEPQR